MCGRPLRGKPMIQNLKYILSGVVLGAIAVFIAMSVGQPDEVSREKIELIYQENAELKSKLSDIEIQYQLLKSEKKNTTKVVYQKADGSSYTRETDKSSLNEQVVTGLKWQIAEKEYRIEQLQRMLAEKTVEKNRPGGFLGMVDFDENVKHQGYSAGGYLGNYSGMVKGDEKLSYSGFSVGFHIPLNL